MRKSLSIGLSVALTSMFTYGLVSSAVDLSETPSTYEGGFRQILLTVERLWSYAHGWQPASHIRDFGGFYAPLIQFCCPLLGFGLFCILSRRHVTPRFWRPLAVAAALTLPAQVSGPVSSGATASMEAGRAALALLAMAWSVGAFERPMPGASDPRR